MVDVYRTAWLPTSVRLGGPRSVGEEMLFRGFLYMGIAASRAGPVMAIIVSSVALACCMSNTIGMGRRRRGHGTVPGRGSYQSHVLLTMLLHALTNAVATLEMVVQESWLK